MSEWDSFMLWVVDKDLFDSFWFIPLGILDIEHAKLIDDLWNYDPGFGMYPPHTPYTGIFHSYSYYSYLAWEAVK